jgi:hypothetical protein
MSASISYRDVDSALSRAYSDPSPLRLSAAHVFKRLPRIE